MSPPLLLKRCLFNFYIKHILYMFIVVAVVVVAVVVIKISINSMHLSLKRLITRNVLTDRYRAICSPMEAHASASSSRSYGICVVIWIVGFCLNIPVFYLWISMIAMCCIKQNVMLYHCKI